MKRVNGRLPYVTPYEQAMVDDAESFLRWRTVLWPHLSFTPAMLDHWRDLYGDWNPHDHRPHGRREWR